jgi:hypothetical protein
VADIFAPANQRQLDRNGYIAIIKFVPSFCHTLQSRSYSRGWLVRLRCVAQV